jgi:hypothetical protein
MQTPCNLYSEIVLDAIIRKQHNNINKTWDLPQKTGGTEHRELRTLMTGVIVMSIGAWSVVGHRRWVLTCRQVLMQTLNSEYKRRYLIQCVLYASGITFIRCSHNIGKPNDNNTKQLSYHHLQSNIAERQIKVKLKKVV